MIKLKLKPGKYFSKADKTTKAKLNHSLRMAAAKMIKESDERYRKAAKNMFRLRLLS